MTDNATRNFLSMIYDATLERRSNSESARFIPLCDLSGSSEVDVFLHGKLLNSCFSAGYILVNWGAGKDEIAVSLTKIGEQIVQQVPGSPVHVSDGGSTSDDAVSVDVDPELLPAAGDRDAVDSALWTGISVKSILTDNEIHDLVLYLENVDKKLDSLGLTQEVYAQVRAYIIASKVLAEAPTPPVDIIWQLVMKANDLAGIATLTALLVAVAALLRQH